MLDGKAKIKLNKGVASFNASGFDSVPDYIMMLNVLSDVVKDAAVKKFNDRDLLVWKIMSALVVKYGLEEAMNRFSKFDENEVDGELEKLMEWLSY